MFMNYTQTIPPTKRQITIWNLKRNEKTGQEIAKEINVDPSFVSRSIKEANKRIKKLLKEVGKMNKIKLDLISGELGIARGHSHIFDITAYITFSPINGLQVWYEHKGECTNCEESTECLSLLLQEFKERNIDIPNQSLQPTDLSELLFKSIEERLK
jgi:hypothetical protein